MSSRQNRRLVSLLLLALLVPCGVLAFLSVRIVRQENELRERRRLEEEEQEADRIARRLLGRHEAYAATVAGPEPDRDGGHADPEDNARPSAATPAWRLALVIVFRHVSAPSLHTKTNLQRGPRLM